MLRKWKVLVVAVTATVATLLTIPGEHDNLLNTIITVAYGVLANAAYCLLLKILKIIRELTESEKGKP